MSEREAEKAASGRRPKRIQRQRTKGWRMPEGAVYVGRPSRWGNPFAVVRAKNWPRWGGPVPCHVETPDGMIWHPQATEHRVIAGRGAAEDASRRRAAALAVELFEIHTGPMGNYEYDDEALDALRRDLAGCDLACWCPLDQPCHADVLLEVANRD